MSHDVATSNRSLPAQASPNGSLRQAVPTALVFGLLVGLGVLGHATHWRFGNFGRDHDRNPRNSTSFLTTIRVEPPLAQAIETRMQAGASLIFDTAESVDRAGINIAPVWTSAMTEYLPASGELSFDPTRLVRVSPRSPGTVWRVLKKIGDTVKPGEVVALIDAVEVGKAKAELHQAMIQFRLRQKALADLRAVGSAVNQRQVSEAEAALKDAEVRQLAAEQVLLNFGLPVRTDDFMNLPRSEVMLRLRGLGVPADVGFDPTTGTTNLLPLRASFAGSVIEVNVVAGEVVGIDKILMTVVDPSQLWLTLHVPQATAHNLVNQQVIRFCPDGASEEASARVNWIGTTADESTRTVPVRAVIDNANGRLRASTLGQGRVVLRETPNAVVVPRDAVQTIRGMPIVFVRHPDFLKPGGPKEFQVRPVVVGTSDDNNTEIISGVATNEIVASKGAKVLLAELSRQLPINDNQAHSKQ